MSSTSKDYKRIWNNLSASFNDAAFYVCCIDDEDEIRKNGAITSEFLRSVLQIGPEDKVLEIGCGVARIGKELAPHCKEWHGVDISGNMIRHARERAADVPNIYLHELPDNSLSIFPDESFDCVYATIVFMHLDKMDMFTYMREAFRVLKIGGRAYFDTYNLLAPDGWREFVKTLQLYPYGTRVGHLSQFSCPEEMTKFMEEAGFDSVHIDGSNPQLVVALGVKQKSYEKPPETVVPVGQVGGEAESEAADSPPPPTSVYVPPPEIDYAARAAELEAHIEEQTAWAKALEQELQRKNADIARIQSTLRRIERGKIMTILRMLKGHRRSKASRSRR